MHVLNVLDVNEALPRALAYLRDVGTPEQTRNGPALVAPGPVATVYCRPQQRVLFDPARDANPFFHLFESLWILAGRRDVRFLSMFNSRIANYSDDGLNYHAAYGWRLRRAFNSTDQIAVACDMLRKNPLSRQVVLQIWGSAHDLNIQSKDLPCNDMVMLRVRKTGDSVALPSGMVLDITVCNRSNDAIWGAYGANAVQFSFIQEYIAAHIGVGVGEYTQMSHNMHVYTENPYWTKWVEHHPSGVHVPDNPYSGAEGCAISPLSDMDNFDYDMNKMFSAFDATTTLDAFQNAMIKSSLKSMFFTHIVEPMLRMYVTREKSYATDELNSDWLMAGRQWVERRAAAKAGATQ